MHFNNVQFSPGDGPYHVGWVTPALHYTLGGVAIDTKGRVKRAATNDVVPGLYAAGEITGGVHGVNRLGGNALTECVVFGQLVGESIDLLPASVPSAVEVPTEATTSVTQSEQVEKRSISATELAAHNNKEDCWIAAYGDVYVYHPLPNLSQ